MAGLGVEPSCARFKGEALDREVAKLWHWLQAAAAERRAHA